ncbi:MULTISPECIES: hypothetical protein, partial [Streptomyces]|uniref:hypothetical protein n=1 Tax=Streptomyces TaxID=1883 RepID=UPI000262F228
MATTGLSIGFRDAISRYGFDTAKRYLMAYHDAVDTPRARVTRPRGPSAEEPAGVDRPPLQRRACTCEESV